MPDPFDPQSASPPTPPGGSPSAGGAAGAPLELVKNGQRYVFDCPPGKEADTMAQLAVLIEADTNDLTWFDAALLCHQLGQRMGDKLRKLKRTA